MKIFKFIFCFYIFAANGICQDAGLQRYLDSLSKYLTKKDDSLKLLAISDLAWEYNSLDVDKAIQLSFQGITIAKKLKREYAIGQAYADLGTSYYFKRDFDSSAMYYLKALKITEKLQDKMELASLYNKLGALFKERAEYQTSLKYSFSALKIYQQLNENHKIALLFNNIGVSYEELKNFRLAESYYKKSLQINEKDKDQGGIARNYIGLGNVSITLRKMDKAYDYYLKASKIFNELGWGIELSATLNNMGDVLDQEKRFSESLAKRKEALQIAVEIEDILGQAKYNLYIADVLLKMKQFSEALLYIHQAERLSKDLQSLEIKMDLYELYSKYHFATNHFEKGNEFLEKFHALKDSVYSADLSKNIALMEVKHNTQQLRLQKAESDAKNLRLSNEKLQSKQQRNYVILTTCILLFAGVIIFYRSKQKLKRREELKRISAMLQSEEEERTRIARDLHDGLGQILSTARINAASLDGSVEIEDENILNTTIQLIDQSIVELREISHNLMPQALSANGLEKALRELVDKINTAKELQVDFKCSGNFPDLEKSTEIIIYRIVQEILNNMLKHAHATRINLNLTFQQQQFSLRIEDNGLGFDTTLIQTSQGIGWRNIQTRVSLLDGQFNVVSGPKKGTIVSIEGKL